LIRPGVSPLEEHESDGHGAEDVGEQDKRRAPAPKEFDGANGDCIDTPRVDGSNRVKSFCNSGERETDDRHNQEHRYEDTDAAALCRSMRPRAKAKRANNAKYRPARITDRRTVPLVIDAVGTTPR